MKRHKCTPTQWETQNGRMTTNSKAKIEFLIPELNDQRLVNTYVHDTSSNMTYLMIIGQDLMQDLGIDVLNSSKTIKWDDQEISQRPRDVSMQEAMQIQQDPPAVQAETKRISDILDAKYEPANLDQIVEENAKMSKENKQVLFQSIKEV